jgi:hypothetical protein
MRYSLAQLVVLSVSVILLSAIIPVNSHALPQVQQRYGYTPVADGVPLLTPEPPPRHLGNQNY